MTPTNDPSRLPAPRAAVRLRVLAAARAGQAPVRTDPTKQLVGLAILAVETMVIAFLVKGGFTNAADRPVAVAMWVVLGTVALALGATYFVLPPRRSSLSPPRGQLLAVVVGVPLIVGAWLVLWHTTYDDPFERVGRVCFGLSMLTSIWPFLALVRASPKLEPRHPGMAGAALGSTAGAWAAVMVNLWCPLSDPGHVAVGHVLPVVVLCGLGAVFGWWRFRMRVVS